MDVSDIISLARTLTHSNSNQVSDAQLLTYVNIIYNKMSNKIISEVDEDYFWDEFITNLVADQNEYSLKEATALASWMKKVTRVECKWLDTDTYKSLVAADTVSNYNTSTGKLGVNLSAWDAFYDVKDGSIFLYPTPTANITEWLKVQAVITLPDLLTTDTSSSVFPRSSELREYHYLLSVWAKQFIYASQGKTNEKNDSINEFNIAVESMIQTLQNRSTTPVIADLPNSNLSI